MGGQRYIISQQTNSKQEKQEIRAASRVFLNFLLETGGYCSGCNLPLSPYFLILIITTELRQSTVTVTYRTKASAAIDSRIYVNILENAHLMVKSSTKEKLSCKASGRKKSACERFVSWLNHRAKPIFNTNPLNVHRLGYILCLIRTLTV